MMMMAALLLTCIRPEPMPLPIEPIDVSPNAVLVKPMRLTKFDRFGRRYWRGAYEVIRSGDQVSIDLSKSNVVILEWACDPLGNGPDVCGVQAGDVLPGFGEQGAPLSRTMELNLGPLHQSTFDGAPVFSALVNRPSPGSFVAWQPLSWEGEPSGLRFEAPR